MIYPQTHKSTADLRLELKPLIPTSGSSLKILSGRWEMAFDAENFVGPRI
jgi:hypothetical protein